MRDKKYAILVWTLFVTLLFSGCQRYHQGGTYVWIDVPINNMNLSDLQPIQIEGHASSPDGISKVEIYIDTDLFATIENPPLVGKLAPFQTTWIPAIPGEYTIQVVAYDNNDQASEIDSARIFFGVGPSNDVPEAAFTPTPTTTETITATTLTPTSTVDTPTPTNTSTLFTPSPTTTFTHTLELPTLTPTITQTPPDTTPPPAPTPAVPADGLSLSCRSTQSLVWAPVSDPSGISEYRVILQRSSDNSNWVEAPDSPITGLTDKTTPISTECGWYYRWRVSAVDGAGNQSEWSSWSYFTITLE